MKLHTIFILLFAVIPVTFPTCKKKDERLSPSDIVRLAFVEEKTSGDAKVIYNKRLNIDTDSDMETIAIIKYHSAERFVIFKKDNGHWKKIRSIDFLLRKPGYYRYRDGKGWHSGKKDSEALARIIQRVILSPIGSGAKRNSVLLEYLRKDPLSPVISSQIRIFTDLRSSFDSLNVLTEHPLVIRDKRIPYRFEKKNKLFFFPDDKGYRAELRFNGRENIIYYPGNTLIYYSAPEIEQSGGPESGYKVTLELKNIGDSALISYISLSFPQGDHVRPLKKGLVRVYRSGARIFNRRARLMAAKYPLLEITKKGWRSYYRTRVRFLWQPSAVSKAARKSILLVRTVSKVSDDKTLSPPEPSSVVTVKDQQGYRAYAFELKIP